MYIVTLITFTFSALATIVIIDPYKSIDYDKINTYDLTNDEEIRTPCWYYERRD